MNYSLHIGLNAVDPRKYGGWDGRLNACEADAWDMREVCKPNGFDDTNVIITKRATVHAVTSAIEQVAAKAKSGDLFVLTYSGHGGQVPDLNGDEADQQDETWVLYDRMLVDDELYSLLAKFKIGVRIFVLSDSCHSGTVVRRIAADWASPIGKPSTSYHRIFAAKPSTLINTPKVKIIPRDVQAGTIAAHGKVYDRIQASVPTKIKAKIKAAVVFISACQDNQYAEDGEKNGLFTGSLLKVWRDNGGYPGTYRQFRNTIAALMPPWQTPNYYAFGQGIRKFESESPFGVKP